MYSTSLLSWTISQALLKNLTILQTFWLFLVNFISPVYVFHMIYPTRSNWQMILSRKKFLTYFLALYRPFPWLKLCLLTVTDTRTSTYRTGTFGWTASILTIDTRHVNNLGPRKFRTGEKNDKKQVCHYNDNKKDRAFNHVLAVRKQTSTDAIIFSIANLENLTFINVLIIQSEPAIRRTSESDTDRRTGTRQQWQQKQQHQQQNDNRRGVSKKPWFLSG